VKISTAQEMFGLGQQLGSQLRAGDLILLMAHSAQVKRFLYKELVQPWALTK